MYNFLYVSGTKYDLFKDQFRYFQNNSHFVSAVFSDGFMEESVKINEEILKVMQIRMKYIKPLIEDGQKLKSFTDAISSEQIIHILMGATRLLMYKWKANKFQFNLLLKGEEMIESVLTLIRTNNSK